VSRGNRVSLCVHWQVRSMCLIPTLVFAKLVRGALDLAVQYDQLRVPYYRQLPALHAGSTGTGSDSKSTSSSGTPFGDGGMVQGGIYQTAAYIKEREAVMRDTPGMC
jgi:hypothetical protein